VFGDSLLKRAPGVGQVVHSKRHVTQLGRERAVHGVLAERVVDDLPNLVVPEARAWTKALGALDLVQSLKRLVGGPASARGVGRGGRTERGERGVDRVEAVLEMSMVG